MEDTTYDYIFTPWKVQGGMSIVASESEWNKPMEWNQHFRFSVKRKLAFVT